MRLNYNTDRSFKLKAESWKCREKEASKGNLVDSFECIESIFFIEKCYQIYATRMYKIKKG